RRPTSQVIGGTVKATMGFLILVAGAGTVVNALEPLGKLILGATGASGVVPTNEAIVALAQSKYGALTAWLMFLGFLASLIVARVAGKKGKSSEEIEFPAGLRFLREPMVGTAVAMLVIYVVFAVWYAGRGDVGLARAAEAVGMNATWGSYLMAQLLNALNFG